MKTKNKKKRLEARIADYYKMLKDISAEKAKGVTCPGSMKK